MTLDQFLVLAVLVVLLVAFAWGRWRYDLVAAIGLLAAVVVGVVDDDRAFLGFGHPAVVTVVAVLVVGKGLERSGLVGIISRRLMGFAHRPLAQLAILCGLVLVASSVINNVGALALFLPVALRMSRETGRAPSLVLLPLAFASLLGGLTTLIGTPPNIIISAIRAEATGEAFGMFAFSPVGVAIALVGVAFVVLLSGRLVPRRRGGLAPEDLFDVGRYVTELEVPAGWDRRERTVRSVVAGADVVVASVVRDDVAVVEVAMSMLLESGDVIVIEGEPSAIDDIIDATGLLLHGRDAADVPELEMLEAIVAPGSAALGRDAVDLHLRQRFGVNLLGIARAGRRIHQRLARSRFEAGDVLLLQGDGHLVRTAMIELGLLPLAPRRLSLGTTRRVWLGSVIFVTSVAVTAAGLLPVQIAFSLAAVAMVLSPLMTLEDAYKAVDLPIVVLLGAMLPIGEAFATTGGAEVVAGWIVSLTQEAGPTFVVAGLMALVMLLSNIVNNAAAAVVAAPIALQVATGIDVSPDPMLMAVAIGASLPLLTPIGHQSNLLVMAPGGYRFGDYWRLGLPISVLAVFPGCLLIVAVWPLAG